MIEFFIYTLDPTPVDVPSLNSVLAEGDWISYVVRGWLEGTFDVVTAGELHDDDVSIGYRAEDPRKEGFAQAINHKKVDALKQWIYEAELGYLMWLHRAFTFSDHSEFDSLEAARTQMGKAYAHFVVKAKRQYTVTNCPEPGFAAASMGAVAFLKDGIVEDPQLGISLPAPANASDLANYLGNWPEQ